MQKKRTFYRNWNVPIESEAIHIFGQAEDLVPTDKSLNLLVWNVFKCQHNDWQQDFEQLSRKHDFMMLQEVYLSSDHSRVHFLPHKLRAIFARSFSYLNKSFSTGVLTSTRFREQKSLILHSCVKEPITQTPKASLVTNYTLAGGDGNNSTLGSAPDQTANGGADEILFINSHIINFRLVNAFYKQLEPIFSLINSHEGAVIFAGDFNTWSKKRMEVLLHFAKEHSLIQVKLREDKRRFPIDHVFIRGVDIIDAKILTHIKSSDHCPLSLTFKIKPL